MQSQYRKTTRRLYDELLAGKYTLTEQKAPDRYQLSNKIWKIEVRKDGKVKWLNSFDDTDDKMKTVNIKSYAGDNDTENVKSEIIGIDKENKTYRQK